jgi:opacity protein-like surface antigen
MNTKLFLIAVAIVTAFGSAAIAGSVIMTTPALAQNMTAGNMTGGNMTGGNMTMGGDDMTMGG